MCIMKFQDVQVSVFKNTVSKSYFNSLQQMAFIFGDSECVIIITPMNLNKVVSWY